MPNPHQNFDPSELAALRIAVMARDEFILALEKRLQAIERFLPLLQDKFCGEIAPPSNMEGVEVKLPEENNATG